MTWAAWMTWALAAEPSAEILAKAEQAEAAWAKADRMTAETLYTEITEAAPTWDKGWRRRCGVVLSLDRSEEAVELCRKAVALSESVENRTALAIALLKPFPGEDPAGRVELDEAKLLLDAALQDQPDYLPAWPALCDWAVNASVLPELERCVKRLDAMRPGDASTLYYHTLLALERGDVERARQALLAARNKGLGDDLYQSLGARIAAAGGMGPVEGGDRPRGAGQGREDAVQSWTELIPWVIAAGLVLAVGILAFIGGNPDDQDKGGPRPPEPPQPPEPPADS